MTVKRAVVMVSIVVCAAGVVSAQTIWEDQSGNPVLPPGPSGAWDEGGRMVGSVVYDGAMWHLYYLNYPQAIGTEAIGHATSATGLDAILQTAKTPIVLDNNPRKKYSAS